LNTSRMIINPLLRKCPLKPYHFRSTCPMYILNQFA
jgi:hypothetical protein